jgi:predicted RNA-binding Zn-ribbon protein involved in translation (DUF1610 family)
MTTKPALPSPAPAGRENAVADSAAGVAPIPASAPDDGVPRVSGGQPLAALPEADIVWTCPDCGSTALRVFYSERRVCQVGTYADGPNDPAPWPSYTGDELVDIDPGTFAFACDACNTHDITPCQKGGTNALGCDQAA